MKKIRENYVSMSFMLSIPFMNILYAQLNNPGRGAHSLITDIDQGIPFIKIFILPYVTWYIFMFLTLCYLCFKDRATYYKTLIALDTGLSACYLVYFFYQTTVPRPELTGKDVLTEMVSFVYNLDRPFNCFPSIHALTSYLMMKAIGNSCTKNTTNYFTVNGIAVLIIASTLLVKQHVILDVLSAILLGEMVFKLVDNLFEKRDLLWSKGRASLLTMKNTPW